MNNGALLLLVEDDTLLRDLFEAILSQVGFELVICSDGEQAAAALQADAARFQCVITDIRLGSGPDGWEVGRRAREADPQMSLLYMSSDSARDWRAKGVPNSLMLTKPFVADRLIIAVSTLIASHRNELLDR